MFPNIEAERVRRSLTKQQLSEKLGISARTYANWMNGKTEIPASALKKMVEMWQTSADYLLGIPQARGKN